MAKKNSVSPTKLLGIGLMVVGVGLALWGYQQADSVGAKITQALSGSEPDKVMLLYIGGAVSIVVGLVLALRR